MPYYPCSQYESEIYSGYTLASQTSVPVCTVPPTCKLRIINVLTLSGITSQGADDGVVRLTTIYKTNPYDIYLNGDIYLSGASTATMFTVTGCSAGNNEITIIDASGCTAQVNVFFKDGPFITGDFTVFEPSEITASENPILFNIQTDVTGSGEYASTTLELISGSTISSGDYIKFTLTSPVNYIQTFTAKGFPNKSNYFLSSTLTDSSGTELSLNTNAEIMQSLADAIQQDSLLPTIYYINYDGNRKITLTAKEQGNRFTLDSDSLEISTPNLVLIYNTDGQNRYDGQQVDDYSIWADVFINTSVTQYPDTGFTNNYQRITQLNLPFSQTNNHQFNLSPIIKNFVQSARPALNFTGFTILPDMMHPYFIRFGELYPLVANTNTKKKRYKGQTTPKWVVNSALDHYSANNMSGYTAAGDYKFLTNAPNPKIVQRNSQEFLYFIATKDIGATLDVRGDLYFSDGTQELNQTFFEISTGTTNAGGVLMLNVSYDKLGLENYETSGSNNRKIKRAEFAVYSGGTQYTEKRAFRFEVEDRPRKFGVLFNNKLGGYDSVDFVGIVEETIDVESGTFTVPLNYNPDGSLGEGFKSKSTYKTRVTKKIICNTGWITQDHFDWLIELMESNDIYSYTTSNQNYLNRTNFNYIKSSIDDKYDVECEFTFTIYENNIS